MLKEIRIKYLLIACCIFLTSCVTMFEPETQTLLFDTQPSGAQMYHENGELIGTTPLELELLKGKTFKFLFKKDGYKEEKYSLFKGTLRMDLSYNCKIDFYYGWLLLGVPIAINRWFAPKRCNYFYKDEYIVKMTELPSSTDSLPEDSSEISPYLDPSNINNPNPSPTAQQEIDDSQSVNKNEPRMKIRY